VLGKDALDRVSSELVTEVTECAAEPGVSPARVLGGELDDQALQRSGRAGSRASSSRGAIVLLRDQLAIPAQDRVGRHQATEPVQHAATERFALRCEAAALGVGEAQAPAAELLTQNAILFLEKRDDLKLAAVHPAREHEQQELQRRDRHLRRSYRAEIQFGWRHAGGPSGRACSFRRFHRSCAGTRRVHHGLCRGDVLSFEMMVSGDRRSVSSGIDVVALPPVPYHTPHVFKLQRRGNAKNLHSDRSPRRCGQERCSDRSVLDIPTR